MKSTKTFSFILSAVLLWAGTVAAQTFTTLHSFTATSSFTNSDGAIPHAGLILSGNILYGTVVSGGSYGKGTMFAINTDGTGFTNLHSFTKDLGGWFPEAGLILLGNRVYGTAREGGIPGYGTVFAGNTDGTGFTNLHSFNGVSDGANPYAGLILSGNKLYGTVSGGTISAHGTVFAVNTDGTGFTNLHSFTTFASGTNSDGANPRAGLILSGNILYGTAYRGGSSGNGTVFAVNTDGTGFTNLHSFTGSSDGAEPYAGLILSGNILYGTAQSGGNSGNGTVFAINTDGTGFTNLHSFTGGNDGANPYAGLILSSNMLYGVAYGGGSSFEGTVFKVSTNGTGFTTLHNFMAASNSPPYGNSDGALPQTGLILSGNNLYGTASTGGSSGNGTVFKLDLSATVTLSNLLQTYDGTAKNVSVTTYPAGLAVDMTYNGSTNAPTNAGNYAVIGTITDTNYPASATNTFVIAKATASVTFSNLSQTYNGTARNATATTTPPGLSVNFTYNGSANAPTNAGSYTVIGTIAEANYMGSATNTLVIAKAPASVTLSNLSQRYDGTAKSVSVSTAPPGLAVDVTYDGSPNAPTNAGGHTVVGMVNELNYQGGATNTLVIISNNPPAANTDIYFRSNGLPLQIRISDLLTNDTDADNDTLTLTNINLTTTNGVTLATNDTFIFYTNAANVEDSFTYTISDGYAGTAQGEVLILIEAPPQIYRTNGNVILVFHGAPGVQYVLQRNTNLSLGAGWHPIRTNTAPGHGVFSVTDTFDDLGFAPDSAYYRLLVP